jgi:hypothetical protein
MQRAKIEELRSEEEVRAFEEEEEEEEEGEGADDEDEEISIREWLVEEVWNDPALTRSVWNVGKVAFLFGLSVWAFRRFPSFMDPEPWTPELRQFQARMASSYGAYY